MSRARSRSEQWLLWLFKQLNRFMLAMFRLRLGGWLNA